MKHQNLAASAWSGGEPMEAGSLISVLCFSHLRWDFVFQRPQHLMSRFAAGGSVYYWEEPEDCAELSAPRLDVRPCPSTGVVRLVPQLPTERNRDNDTNALRDLLDSLVLKERGDLVRWYYTPMMLPFSEHVQADCVVYDCMDELANFKNAPPELIPLEKRLLAQADLVFTGGHSLCEAKRDRHPSVHPFPSGVDV